jgi:hypothetical protein
MASSRAQAGLVRTCTAMLARRVAGSPTGGSVLAQSYSHGSAAAQPQPLGHGRVSTPLALSGTKTMVVIDLSEIY